MKEKYQLWWKRYHNHVYGFASLAGLVLAIIFYFAPPSPNKHLSESEKPSVSRKYASELIDKPWNMPTPFKINRDFKRRDAILNINVNWHEISTGAKTVNDIDVKTLERLFIEKFIDPQDKHNNAPTALEILNFIQSHPNVLASGWVFSPLRGGYSITLDGLKVYPSYVTQELKISFFEFCKGADEIETDDGLWCWWD
ncbi:MAG: hypothetical protein KKC30_05600 [Proteobacteria bacterium]|nr:hypothetical protein [Pseudomonadota bacterium]MBU4384309.1 hypothetical protein [Pseudomonadota bacterium]MBU4604623.1 hypothetical protein [Pseudomonadota bacterium]MCG2764127.1 hypothetical protein [Desulfarculaceae bacterium]